AKIHYCLLRIITTTLRSSHTNQTTQPRSMCSKPPESTEMAQEQSQCRVDPAIDKLYCLGKIPVFELLSQSEFHADRQVVSGQASCKDRQKRKPRQNRLFSGDC